jgi:TRAP-type C4-dicarboxylate transport system permease large subunit
MVTGVVMIAPLLVGGSSPVMLVQYFSNSIGKVTTSPAFLPILPELVVLLAALLLMSALYALRRASSTLNEEGLMNR